MTAVQLAGIALAALLSENFILVSCLGIGSRTQAFRDPLDAWRTGYSLTAVMVVTALAAWVVNQLLRHFALSYFQTLAFALTGPLVVAGLRYFLRTCIPELSRRMDENLSSVTSNCAAMGTALLIAQRGYGPGGAFLYALFCGAGATVAMMCFAGLRREVSLTSCPRCFQGLPINLISEIAVPISLSLRLFANVLSGTVMMALIYGLLGVIATAWPAALHVYFDLFSGAIQTYVFCMLTMTYIANARGDA